GHLHGGGAGGAGCGGLRRGALLVARQELHVAAVVLLDVGVGAVELQRLEILLACVVEVAVRLVRHGQVVVSHGVAGIDLRDAADAAEIPAPLRNDDIRRQVEALPPPAVTLADDDYPRLLKEIVDPPPALFFRGDLALAHTPSVAMVGSRRASPYAINAAQH